MADHTPTEFGPFLGRDYGDDSPLVRWLLTFILVLVTVCGLAGLVHGEESWGTSPPAVAGPAPIIRDGWFPSTRYPGWYYQIQAGSLRAWFETAGKKYHEVGRDGQMLPASRPPWEPLEKVEQLDRPTENFGVDPTRIQEAPAYHCRDGVLSRAQAMAMVTAPDLDDSQKYHITAVGPKDWTDQVTADMRKSGVADSGFVVKAVSATHWWVKERLELHDSPDFVKTGRAVVVQEPDGTAVHAQFDWAPGDGDLFAMADFKKIPDLRRDLENAQGTLSDFKTKIDQLLAQAKEFEALAAKVPEVQKKLDDLQATGTGLQTKLAALIAQVPDIKKDIDLLATAATPILWLQANGKDVLDGAVLLAIGLAVAVVIYKNKKAS